MHKTWAYLWLCKISVNMLIHMQWFKLTETDNIITMLLTSF